MNFFLVAAIFFAGVPAIAVAETNTIRGKIIDASTGEEIIGAAVILKELANIGTVTGLDGSFILNTELETCTLLFSSIGYKDAEIIFSHSKSEDKLLVSLEPDNIALDAVIVTADNKGKTEASARGIERASMNVVNVMSAKAMELSPDLTVANAIRRMSGVTVERNSSGEGQYAILT